MPCTSFDSPCVARELEYDNAALRSLLANGDMEDVDIDAEVDAARAVAQELSAAHQAGGLVNISQLLSATPRRKSSLASQEPAVWMEWNSSLDVTAASDGQLELSTGAIQASLLNAAASPRRTSLMHSTTLDLDSQPSSGRTSPRPNSQRTSPRMSPRSSVHSGALALDGTDNWLNLEDMGPSRSPRSSLAQAISLSPGVDVDRGKMSPSKHSPRYSKTFGSPKGEKKPVCAKVADV
jgi:hypothetical protein